MGCYDDMRTLLDDVADIRKLLEREYDAARANPSVKDVLRPKVKSALEQLRSVLEYSAHELRDKHCGGLTPDTIVYFPYARTKSRFYKGREKNLPGLTGNCPGAAAIIESIQPFASGDDWLIRLCEQVNLNKHHGLGKQVRVNSSNSRYSVEGLVKNMGGHGNVLKVGKMFVNGQVVNGGKPITLTSEMMDEEIAVQTGSDPRLKVSREFEWVEFHFASSAEDALKLIGKAHNEISAYTEAIKAYF